jgi:4-hydroxy-3-polyprenylbenzoate decarboxylase
VISRAARHTIAAETNLTFGAVRSLATKSYAAEDIGAAIASGSFQCEGMIVAPCSIRSAAEIATGTTTSLLTRAADVTLKERRRLVLMIRETPLHTGHLRMLTALSEIGAVIAPPVPAFYAKPATLDDLVNHTVGRVLDLFGIANDLVRRWQPEKSARGDCRPLETNSEHD